MNERIKSILTPQVIIYTVIGLGVGVYLFLTFFSGETENTENVTSKISTGENVTTGGRLLAQNEKPQGKDFFEGYKDKRKERATLDFEYNPNETPTPVTNLADNTDDKDIEIIQQALRGEATKPQQNAAPSTYTPVVRVEPQAQPQQTIVPIEQQKPTPKIEEQEIAEVEEPKKTNRFFEGKRKAQKGNTLSCVVHGEQEIMNGSTLKLRLLEDFTTPEGRSIEKGTTLWGVCALTKERMLVTIESVLIDKNLIPLNFEAYDLDGLEGINLPNNVKAEIAKRAKAEAIRQSPTDDIIGNGGVLERGAKTVTNTTKQLLSRKQEEIKIKVKSNYQLALKPLTK